MRFFASLVLLSLLPVSSAYARTVDGPVAVMPFRNLNQSKDLVWLELGIAETMIADLRKSGRVGIVERSQIAHAIQEIKTQAAPGSEVAQAVKVGKLVGARTIVVGSFQKAGKDIRITARFVSVESGVVKDTAKATGPEKAIFSLQDEITNRLLGLPPRPKAPPPRRAKRASSNKEVKAYRLYAMSLTTMTDANRVGLLKQALEVDPNLLYAIEDLASLETRMATYARISGQKLSEREKKIRTRLYDAKTPDTERVQLAQALLEGLVAARRFYTLAHEAARVYEAKITPSLLFDPSEYASFCMVLAHERLRMLDLALQHGERHLKEFPAGKNFREAERMMNKILEKRREVKEQRQEYADELKEAEDERAELMTKHGKIPADRAVDLDYSPCIAAKWSKLPAEMIQNCSAFIQKYKTSTDAEAKEFVLNARAYVIWGHSLTGNFKDARSLADVLQTEAPAQLAEIGLRDIIDNRWPTD